MKKIIILLALIIFTTSPLFAGAITDSTKPLGHMKLSATVEDNYIFSRDVKKPENRTKFETEKINQIYAKAALGLTPYFNLYGKLGASDCGEITDETTSDAKQKIETDYGLVWGLGASGAKEFYEGWKVGLDAQFNWWKAGADKITYIGVKASGVSGDIINFEYQVTPFITKRIEIPQQKWAINPYLGVKFSYFKTETDKQLTYNTGIARTDSWTLHSKDNVGIVVGSDLEINRNLALQLEGRFIDETAISGGGTYKF